MARGRARSVLRTGRLLAVLLGTVVVPALGTLTIGIVALTVWREAFDLVFGVLVLVFAVMAVIGGFLSYGFIRGSEQLAQMQTDFVANVSHELRTPLAGIRLMVETLERGRAETPERRAEVLGLLKERTSHLEALVERILRWRRLDRGATVYQLTRQSVQAMIAEAAAPFYGPDGGGVEVTIRGELPDVEADREAFVDALRNLIDNAVKYGGEHGPPEVIAYANDNDVVIEVRDQGPGIPRGDRNRIFDRFYRIQAHMRYAQGTGLGLAIVRHVVHGHHGRIRVESEPGSGAAFIIDLPAAKAVLATPPVDAETASSV